MTLAVVIPAWRRYAVTRVCLAQKAQLVRSLAARGITARIVVVADDENLDIAADHGFDTVRSPNDRVGRKWNDGIAFAAHQLEADYITVVGSDDWIHEDVFAVLPADVGGEREPTPEEPCVIWKAAPEAVTGREIALVDVKSGRLRRCRSKGRYGVIPWVFPRAALAKSGFRPVNDEASRGLDGSLATGLGLQPSWVFHDPHDLCRIDFKTDVNLNSYETISGAIGYGDETDAWQTLRGRYPDELVTLAQELTA